MLNQILLRRALWTALLVAGAVSAQEAAISGADFTNGKANAQLNSIGARAAASGKTVVVTAPTYWQAKIAARIRAGAHGKPVAIRFSNGFYENVLVRTETAAPAPAEKPETGATPKPAAKPEVAAAPKAAAKTAARPSKPQQANARPASVPEIAPAPRVVPKPPQSAPYRPVEQQPAVHAAPGVTQAPMPSAAPNPQAAAPAVKAAPQPAQPQLSAVPQVSNRPAVVPTPTATPNPTGVKPALPQAEPNAGAARTRLLATLNGGRPALGSLGEGQLQPGDQVYEDGNTRAAVRLEGLHRSFYWLSGPVDLQRVQYSPLGGGRYEVNGRIDPAAPAKHRAEPQGSREVAAAVPASGSPARARLERDYNNGNPITDRIGVAQLQPDDRLLVDGNTVLVVRREGNSMARYWLEGSIDLSQRGLQKTDANIYRVTGNNLH